MIFNNKNFDLALILTASKVGTIAIKNSLERTFPKKKVEYAHFLVDTKRMEKNVEMKKRKETIKNLINNTENTKIKIVTLVRDPIARRISHVFHNAYLSNNFKNEMSSIENFSLHLNSFSYNFYLNWFNRELHSFLGFDIYENPYQKEKGYQIYKHNNIDILCLTLEKISDLDPNVFKKFFGKKINISEEHTTQEKPYAKKYNYYKNNCIIDDKTLNQVYNAKLVKHFYTKNDIEQFIKKWSKK